MNRAGWIVAVAFGSLFAGEVARAGEPVWGKEMVDSASFPSPFGVSAVWFSQEQEYEIEKLVVGIPGFSQLPVGQLAVDNELDEVNAKFDAWLLPWLNVFAIAGKLDGTTRVDFSAVAPLFQLPFTAIDIEYDGEVYGGGFVLAAGTDRLFGSLTTILTSTSLSGDFDSSADAFVVTPRVGVHNRRGALYLGAMYQEATEEHDGTIALPLVPGLPPIPVPFEVDLKQQDDFNWLVGGTAALGTSWTLQAEVGFGDRDHVDVELGYRF